MKRIGKVMLLLLLFVALAGIMNKGEARAAATYKIKINKACCTVNVYKYNGTKYKCIKAFVCSPGYATPTGTFYLGEKMRWHTLDGPTYGQYCTRITGSILFHSVWYYQPQKNTQSYVQYNKLGTLASHGCVRLTVADAKWIFDNVPSGTSVKIYNNSAKAGPLGKPSAIKVSGYQGWDPTDPDPANPYAKKNPKIYGVKKKITVDYGDSVNLKAGVTAKNTTGFSATNRIKLSYYYRATTEDEYQKVKKFDTSVAGIYKVVYKVTDEIGHTKTKNSIVTVKPAKLVKKITLNKTEKTLYLGGKESLASFALKVKSIKPDAASIKDVKFTSAGTKIATVDENGVITAHKKGQVYIKVQALDGSGVYERCLITVEQLVTKVKVSAPADTLEMGTSMQLKVTLTPKTANNLTVTYKSSDETIATVSKSGSVTAIAPGTVNITVTANDKGKKKVKLKVTVYDPEASDAVSGSAVSGDIEGGETPPGNDAAGTGAPASLAAVFPAGYFSQDADSRIYRKGK